MSKLIACRVAIALLFALSLWGNQTAQANWLVETSTHFIEVPASAGAQTPTIRLAATLYEPRFLPAAPAVIYIHGWGGRRLTDSDNLASTIAAAGYVVLSYTARGFGEGESGGRVTLAGADELSDLDHIIDWLLNDPARVINPRVTKIGVVGASYGGGHSFQIANHPRVSAVCPLVGWTDLEQALYPNGAINYQVGLGHFYSGLEGRRGAYNYDRLQFEMFDAAAEGRPLSEWAREALAERSIAERDAKGQTILKPGRQPQAPIFIIQSWDDYLFPATQVMDVYSQITAPKQLYLGRSGHPPGGHSYEGEELYIATQLIRWFDHFLRDIGGKDSKTISSAPSPFGFQLYNTAAFSPNAVTMTPLYLKANGILSPNKKGKKRSETLGGTFRPELIRPSYQGSDVPKESEMMSAKVEASGLLPQRLIYTLPAWRSETEIFGASEITLFISSATSSTVDIIVRLFDVAPDGAEAEISVGVMRVSGLMTDEIRRVSFRDFGDHWVFRPGHALRVKISNLDFPAFRPPGVNDNLLSHLTLQYGKISPSVIHIPMRKK